MTSTLLFALTLAASHPAQPATAPQAGERTTLAGDSKAPSKDTPEDKGDELGFFERYFPFTMHETYSEPVQEIMVGVWIGAVFCPGIGVLVGNLMLGDGAPEESDLMGIALWHIGLRLTSLILALPTGGLTSLVTLADMAYLAPVAILNGFDRALTAQGAAPPKDGGPKKKSKKQSRSPGPGVASATVHPSSLAMAY